MKCPRCSHDNLPTAKFCQECGAALARACRACAAPLPDKARFCPACGTAVEGAASAPAESVSRDPAAERRQATVLFADIAGYTQLCARLDAEQVQALLNRFYAAIDATVAAYGGVVIDHAGDGVLAVFGAPLAHDNDPERALRAALAMQAAAAQIAEPASGRALALHIGIAAGEVVAAVLEGGARPKYTVTGDAVNLAARLDALAGAGETVLSAAVQRSVAALVDCDDLGDRTLKGFAAPVRVWRVRALRSAAAEGLPFVGRQAELRQLEGVLDSLRDTGCGAVLLIRGDPGIGKSRLVEELARRALARGCAVHVGRVLDFGVAKGQEALPALLAALLGLPAQATEGERRAALVQAIGAGRIEPEHDMLLADLLGIAQRDEQAQALFDAMDNATRQRRSASAVAALATQAARARPRLLVIEDVHWATPLLLGCLAALAMVARERALLLALTTRFEGDPIDRAWRAASHGTPLLTIDMGPLSREEARQLAAGMIESSERQTLDCIERAEGNPLFLEQLLRNALESESAASVPPTIQSLVLARIDRLAPRDKQALQAASVIGKRFAADALAHVLADANHRCEALLATDLVRPEAGDFLFAHALIQEGVYASLLHARKRELHRRAAEWYCEREPALHAEHLDRAQDAAAVPAYLAAAEDAARRARFDEALRLAERGRALAGEGEAACAFALLAGDVLRELAPTVESSAAFERALAAASDDAARCRAWLGCAAGHRVTGDIDRALAALAAAQPLTAASGDRASLARIHSLRGNLSFAAGRSDECGREHALALEHALAAGDAEAEALAYSGLGDHAYAQGRMQTALGHFRRCVELCRRVGAVRAEIVNGCMVGHCLDWIGEGDAGLAEIRQAQALSQRVGVPQTEVMTLESLAMALTLRGDYAEAEPWLARAIDAARAASSRRFLSVDLVLLAHVRRAQGRSGEARALVAEAIELAEQTGIGFLGPAIYAAMAAACDGLAERRAWLAKGEALLATDCLEHGRILFYRDAIDAVLADGHEDEALRYAAALERHATAGEAMAVARLAVARARALVRWRREGPSEELADELRALAAETRRAGMGAMALGIESALAAAGLQSCTPTPAMEP
jgi:class 3 adenylate cyclase